MITHNILLELSHVTGCRAQGPVKITRMIHANKFALASDEHTFEVRGAHGQFESFWSFGSVGSSVNISVAEDVRGGGLGVLIQFNNLLTALEGKSRGEKATDVLPCPGHHSLCRCMIGINSSEQLSHLLFPS